MNEICVIQIINFLHPFGSNLGESPQRERAQAQRAEGGKPTGANDFTQEFKVAPTSSDEDGTVAVWPDGHEAAIAAFPVKLVQAERKTTPEVVVKKTSSATQATTRTKQSS
ncbi:MAG: hypothetical protein ACKPKO_11865, partial [Candidatus Fonsibacter sp.]